jgi:uncharacterized protein YjdB
MKKTMKSISILIALMFLVTGICVVPTAAADVTYSVSPVIGATGETVTVAVSLSTSVDLWGSNVQLKYNPAELQVVSFEKGSVVSNGSINDSGSSVNFSGVYGAKSGTVFTVSFKILMESGKSSLVLSSSENTDTDGKDHSYTVSNGSVTVLNKVPAEKVTLDKTSVSLKKGETAKLKATVSPSNTTDNVVTYYSSDDDIVTVSADGTITAVKGGTATITALAGEKTAKCTVTVSVTMTGIKADGNTSRNAFVGDKINLSVLKVPADATDAATAKWTTSNPNVATVSSNGVVTAVAPGETTITATVNKWKVDYKITIADKTGESTTAESTTEESTTVEESTTEENTTEESTTYIFVTEPTTSYFDTTMEDFSLVEPTSNEFANEYNEGENSGYLYLLILATAGVVTVVIGAVTFFVTKGYYGTKKKQKIIVEEKFKR